MTHPATGVGQPGWLRGSPWEPVILPWVGKCSAVWRNASPTPSPYPMSEPSAPQHWKMTNRSNLSHLFKGKKQLYHLFDSLCQKREKKKKNPQKPKPPKIIYNPTKKNINFPLFFAEPAVEYSLLYMKHFKGNVLAQKMFFLKHIKLSTDLPPNLSEYHPTLYIITRLYTSELPGNTELTGASTVILHTSVWQRFLKRRSANHFDWRSLVCNWKDTHYLLVK